MSKARLEERNGPSRGRFGFAQRLLRMSGLGLSAFVTACADQPPTSLDGSSPEAFARSAKQARQDLPVADRIIFDRALRTVGGRRHAMRDPDALARTTFDGMTAQQIVADQKARD